MLFRDATPEDVPFLEPMLIEQYRLHGHWDPAKFAVKPGFQERYGGWMKTRAGDPSSVFLVAEVDHEGDSKGRVVGFLIATLEKEMPLYVNESYGFIHDLWVDEGYRNEGIARQLVSLAIERFKAMGTKQVRCETAQANEVARSLFRSAGFRPTTVVMLTEI